MKRRKMRMTGVTYPDVYALPDLLTDRLDFIRDGSTIPAGRYDLLLSELNRSNRQLEYLAEVIKAGHRLAVIPGPPDLLGSVLDQRMIRLVREVLEGASAVWAYSASIRDFADGLIGRSRAELIPWPFDAEEVRRIGATAKAGRGRTIRFLFQIPLRFSGVGQTFPFVLKAALTDVLNDLPSSERERIRLHTFVYTESDRKAIETTGFSEGIPLVVERKRGYRGFVRMIAQSAGVINLTAGDVLGRITFLSGALNRPGIFSDNTELNRTLYPGAVSGILDPAQLRALLSDLIEGALAGDPPRHLLPDQGRVDEIGNRERNVARMAEIAANAGVL